MKTTFYPPCIVLALLTTSVFNAQIPTAHAQGTAFLYQGQLNTMAGPANGNYDFTFSLYTANSGGSQVGGTLTNLGVYVGDGLFATLIDFGPGIFTGSSLWLDIGVRTNGGGSFMELLSGQALLPVPYAIMANSSSNLLGLLPAEQLSGTIPLGQLPAAVVMNNQSGVTLNGTFSGNGFGLMSLNPANVCAGTAAINISGNAATATTAATAVSATTANGVSPGSVTGAGIASGQVVKSLNGLEDAVTLSPGANITITPNGSTLTIASAGAGSGAASPATSVPSGNITISGDGTNIWLNATQYNGFNIILSGNAILNITNGPGAVADLERKVIRVRQSPSTAQYGLYATNCNIHFGTDMSAFSILTNTYFSVIWDNACNRWDVVSQIRGY